MFHLTSFQHLRPFSPISPERFIFGSTHTPAVGSAVIRFPSIPRIITDLWLSADGFTYIDKPSTTRLSPLGHNTRFDKHQPDYIQHPTEDIRPYFRTTVMGFSLFKKKNKDKTAAASPNLSVPNGNRPMASPNLRVSPNTPSSTGSPRVFGTPMTNSPALSVNEWGQVPSIATGRRIKLRCVLDPLPNASGGVEEELNNKGEALKELFYITTELDAPVETLRHQIEQELGVEGKYSVGIFKVCLQRLSPYRDCRWNTINRSPFRGQLTTRPRLILSDTLSRST